MQFFHKSRELRDENNAQKDKALSIRRIFICIIGGTLHIAIPDKN